MKIAKIEDSISNGEGVRVVVWTQGCIHACEGCHNPQTWNPKGGEAYTKETEEEILTLLSRPYIKGITFSGGDPLHPQNRQEVLGLCRRIKQEQPNKDIWLYSGFTYEEISAFLPELFEVVDVLVDGKFILSLYSPALQWRGSSNQRVIDVQASRKHQQVVLYEM